MNASAPLPSLPVRRFQTTRTITALILREMSSTYGRSPGGYLWAVLEPIGTILILALGFSLLVRTPALGTSFILFYATGYLPFGLYQSIAQKTASALRYSKSLLAYPRVGWLHAVIARFILEFLTGLTVFTILISGILLVIETRTQLDISAVLIGLSIAAATAIGVGLLNCLLFSFYPVWQQIWGIVTRPLFIASGVFFLYDDMPRVAQEILWWNPLLHATGEVRRGFYPTYDADYVSLSYCFGLTLTASALGLLLLHRFHKRVLES